MQALQTRQIKNAVIGDAPVTSGLGFDKGTSTWNLRISGDFSLSAGQRESQFITLAVDEILKSQKISMETFKLDALDVFDNGFISGMSCTVLWAISEAASALSEAGIGKMRMFFKWDSSTRDIMELCGVVDTLESTGVQVVFVSTKN